MAVFRHIDLKIYLLDLVESLLVAWVLIRLVTSVLREAFWTKFIAVSAWTITALHILSLLNPLLVLLDSLAITIGETRLTAFVFIKATIFLFILVRLASIISTVFKERIGALDGLTPSVRILLSKTVSITLTVVAILVATSSLGIDLTAFAFIGGAVGVGIGFGLQKVVSNLVSGLVLLLDRSIKPGDVIAIDETYGQIKDMDARYVSIVTRDGAEHLIPNEDLITSRVVNWSYSSKHLRIRISVGVSYDADLHQVKELMISTARENSRVLGNPKPVCQLKRFGEYSIEMELRFWIRDPESGVANVSSDIRMAIWEAFQANNIEIPFPQRVIHSANQLPKKD
jgi:small-conductance mechanosensitive channel